MTDLMIYTGIGARATAPAICELMYELAKVLGERGFILRSGGAEGADTAFAQGARAVAGTRQIFLPWKNFNGVYDGIVVPDNPKITAIASQYHPNWSNLSDPVKKLHSRNVPQVLGLDLETKSDFVVCYTPNGSGYGGTGQALRIARAYKIPVYDLGHMSEVKKVQEFLKNPSKLHPWD